MVCHFLIQGIFPIQGAPASPALQVDSLLLSHWGNLIYVSSYLLNTGKFWISVYTWPLGFQIRRCEPILLPKHGSSIWSKVLSVGKTNMFGLIAVVGRTPNQFVFSKEIGLNRCTQLQSLDTEQPAGLAWFRAQMRTPTFSFTSSGLTPSSKWFISSQLIGRERKHLFPK